MGCMAQRRKKRLWLISCFMLLFLSEILSGCEEKGENVTLDLSGLTRIRVWWGDEAYCTDFYAESDAELFETVTAAFSGMYTYQRPYQNDAAGAPPQLAFYQDDALIGAITLWSQTSVILDGGIYTIPSDDTGLDWLNEYLSAYETEENRVSLNTVTGNWHRITGEQETVTFP